MLVFRGKVLISKQHGSSKYKKNQNSKIMPTLKTVNCDYLVVGAGASPLAFIDTLLTEIPQAKIILVDKKAAPGGHWNQGYEFVRLHQPSLVYGVASKQLEGNWLKLMATKFTLPWNHRATKQEILTYFGDFVQEKVASKQLEWYPNTVYNFTNDEDTASTADGMHTFSSLDGSVTYQVKVNIKLVNGTAGECIIPSQSPLQFPVDEGVQVMTPNQIFDAYHGGKLHKKLGTKFVLLGAGKTAMDTVVYLQRTMKIRPDDIAWVIPNDVWMLCLEGRGSPWDWPKTLLECEGDEEKASLLLEKSGGLTRLDENIMPTRFRFPVVPNDELKLLRKIKNIIRRGRATAIRKDGNKVVVDFGNNHGSWEAFASVADLVFVHATSPGPFNGKDSDDLFVSDDFLTLNLLTAPPISSSMSMIAKIEAARHQGTLDLDFARQLFHAYHVVSESSPSDDKKTDNDVLRWAIRGYKLSDLDAREKVKPLVTLAMFIAVLDKDPTVAINWMKSNRLTFFSIPGFKGHTYEHMLLLCEKGRSLGFSENDIRVFNMLAGKLKPLEGM
jgi:hypothetical protein